MVHIVLSLTCFGETKAQTQGTAEASFERHLDDF